MEWNPVSDTPETQTPRFDNNTATHSTSLWLVFLAMYTARERAL